MSSSQSQRLIRFCALALALLTVGHVSVVVAVPDPAARTAKRQAIRTIISEHKKAQAHVDAALDDHANLADMVCRAPANAGFMNKNSSVHLSATMKDRAGVLDFIQAGVPIYDSCQVSAPLAP